MTSHPKSSFAVSDQTVFGPIGLAVSPLAGAENGCHLAPQIMPKTIPPLSWRGMAVALFGHLIVLATLFTSRHVSETESDPAPLMASLILDEAIAESLPDPALIKLAPTQALPRTVQPHPLPVRPGEPPSVLALPEPVPAPAPAIVPTPRATVEPVSKPEPAVAVPIAPPPQPYAEKLPPPAVTLAAPQAAVPAHATQAVLPGKKEDVKAYIAALMRQLNRHKTYPVELKKAKTEGRVVLLFTLDKSGRLLASAVKQSSGHPDLDRAALAMLARANPLPAIPDFMERDELALAIPVEYSLITDR